MERRHLAGNARAVFKQSNTMVRVGREKRQVRARKATPEERARLWPRFVETWAENEEYAKRTEREMPVVLLEPRPG